MPNPRCGRPPYHPVTGKRTWTTFAVCLIAAADDDGDTVAAAVVVVARVTVVLVAQTAMQSQRSQLAAMEDTSSTVG
jgi:hypothetical protein